jgi:8-oxo-dGTP diphosphatase
MRFTLYIISSICFLTILTAQGEAMDNRPKVGVGVLIIKDAKVLLGKRKNAHGDGTWAPPGGHLEFEESLEECAKREVLEETGLILKNVKKYDFTNDVFVKENKHYLTVFMITDELEGEPHAMEPEKCECWAWFGADELPDNLFLPLKNLGHYKFLTKSTI